MRADRVDTSPMQAALVATVRDDIVHLGRSGFRNWPPCARTPGSGCTSTPPMPGRPWVCPELRWSQAGRRPPRIRWSSTRTSGCSLRWTAQLLWTRKPEALRAAFRSRPRVSAHEADEAESLSDYGPCAWPAAFRSLKLWGGASLLRPRGTAGADQGGDPARRAVRRLDP